VISNHGAFEPTKMCSVGRMERGVHERAHCDVHEGSVAHEGEEQRPADAAPRVVRVLLAEDEQGVRSVRELELPPLDPRERLEGGPGRRPAARAVAVRGVEERVLDPVADGAALTAALEHAPTIPRRFLLT
jgi:hypothetical protein